MKMTPALRRMLEWLDRDGPIVLTRRNAAPSRILAAMNRGWIEDLGIINGGWRLTPAGRAALAKARRE